MDIRLLADRASDGELMTSSEAVETISKWFQDTHAAGLVLPDGWFGRPYDNLHELTYSAARPHKVLLELDDQLLLVLTSLATVRIEASELILAGFDHCVFDWQEYGSLVSHVTVYQTGIVKFVPPVGRS